MELEEEKADKEYIQRADFSAQFRKNPVSANVMSDVSDLL